MDRRIRVWDARDWGLIRQFEAEHPEVIVWLTLSADGRRLLTAGIEALGVANPAHLILWEVSTGKELGRLRLSQGPASAALSPNGRTGHARHAPAEASVGRQLLQGLPRRHGMTVSQAAGRLAAEGVTGGAVRPSCDPARFEGRKA